MNLKAITANEKRVLTGTGDINQLAPFKYPWAWEFFLNANKNHWTPLDINMSQDIHDYNHKLTPEEQHVYTNVLAYLTTSDVIAMRNIGLAVMEKMTAPELQMYQARQVYEESLHTWSYQHCIESLGMDQSDIYNRYRVVPELRNKIMYANTQLDLAMKPLDTTNKDDIKQFVLSYMFFAGIFEGSWFYNGFSPIFALQRRGLMRGTGEMLQYIMRDEVMHASFGIRIAKQIMIEENIVIDDDEILTMFTDAGAIEETYAHYLLPTPMAGYTAEDHFDQYKFIANRRARSLGTSRVPYPGAVNALPWLDEQANMRKEKNFFETRVTEYQTGGLEWD